MFLAVLKVNTEIFDSGFEFSFEVTSYLLPIVQLRLCRRFCLTFEQSFKDNFFESRIVKFNIFCQERIFGWWLLANKIKFQV